MATPCFDGNALLIKIFEKALEGTSLRLVHRAKRPLRFRRVQRAGQTADMVVVRMRGDDIVQRLDIVLHQVGINPTGALAGAAVDQHVVPIAAKECRVALSDVDEVQLERAFGEDLRRRRAKVRIACDRKAEHHKADHQPVPDPAALRRFGFHSHLAVRRRTGSRARRNDRAHGGLLRRDDRKRAGDHSGL